MLPGPRFFNAAQSASLCAAAALGTNNMLFWTFTPDYVEHTSSHITGEENAADRPDAIIRVFDGIWRQLCDDIRRGAFIPLCRDDVIAHFWLTVIEFQKRGLIHGHGIAKFPGTPFTAAEVRKQNSLHAVIRVVPELTA